MSHLKVVSDDLLDKSDQKSELLEHKIVEDVADVQKSTEEESVSFFDVTSYFFLLISHLYLNYFFFLNVQGLRFRYV